MKGLVGVLAITGLMFASVAASEELKVGKNQKYTKIQKAIDEAKSGDTISVEVGTYNEDLTLRAGITLTVTGAETARTFLKAASTNGAVITATGVKNNQISRFTFIESTTGISTSKASTLTIAANVFNLGSSGTAVIATDVEDSSNISNNTFYSNKLAVSRAGTATKIENNIFSSNATAISSPKENTNISSNQFYSNTTVGQSGEPAVTDINPSFVNPDKRDFHVKVDSSGRGAYSGILADPKPFPVQKVEISDSSSQAPNFTVTVSWTKNESYLSANYSYILYYYFEGKEGAFPYNGTEATSLAGPSPQNVGESSSVTISGSVPLLNNVINAPVLNPITPQSQAFRLSWNQVANATSYELHYGIKNVGGSFGEDIVQNVGNVAAYVLSGLQNNETYRVAVVAVLRPILHVAITAQDKVAVSNASAYSSEAIKALGMPIKSVASYLEGIPEEVVAFPKLPNEGCFIATAAYGSYSAAQVKTLRDFRDHYLLTNTPGRAFVSWYYANSPPAAHYLNQHPALKPVVRSLLLPFVFITSWMNGSTMEMQMGVVVFAIGLLGLGIYWRRRTSWA